MVERLMLVAGEYAVREHDGISLLRKARSDEEIAGWACSVTKYKWAIKHYDDPWEFLQRKFPDFQRGAPNEIGADAFSRCMMECWRAVSESKARCSDINLLFRDAFAGLQESSFMIFNGSVEYYDGQRWHREDATEGLNTDVRNQLCSIFARPVFDDGEIRMIYSTNLEDGNFHKQVAKSLGEFAVQAPSNTKPLDEHNENLLLHSNGIVVDFQNGLVKRGTPEMRLCKHAASPFKKWVAPEPVLALVIATFHDLFNFYLGGGVSLLTASEADDAEDAQPSQLTAEAQEALAKTVAMEDLRKGIVKNLETLRDWKTGDSFVCDALRQLWATFEDWDFVVYWIRVECRILSGARGFAECYILTGPPNCGKSKLLLRVMQPLGCGQDNLGRMVPNNYFTAASSRDANASQPATNKLRGCRAVSVKESPAGKIQPENLKNILDMTDVNIDARANHSSAKAETSFPVSWTIAFASNAEVQINTAADRTGLSDKIIELRPPFLFVADSEKTGDARERSADSKLMDIHHYDAIYPEVLHFAMAAWPLVSRQLCQSRRMTPMPPACAAIREQMNVVADVSASAGAWALRSLVYCDRKDASTVPQVLQAASDSGHGASEMTAAGFGSNQQSRRRTGGHRGGKSAVSDQIFEVKLKPGDPRGAVRLRREGLSIVDVLGVRVSSRRRPGTLSLYELAVFLNSSSSRPVIEVSKVFLLSMSPPRHF